MLNNNKMFYNTNMDKSLNINRKAERLLRKRKWNFRIPSFAYYQFQRPVNPVECAKMLEHKLKESDIYAYRMADSVKIYHKAKLFAVVFWEKDFCMILNHSSGKIVNLDLCFLVNSISFIGTVNQFAKQFSERI